MAEQTSPETALSVIQLPELPITFDNDGIIKFSLALLIVGILLILIAFLFFHKKA